MPIAKHSLKRKRAAKVVPALGAAGLLSLAGGASAATGGAPLADLPTQKTYPTDRLAPPAWLRPAPGDQVSVSEAVSALLSDLVLEAATA